MRPMLRISGIAAALALAAACAGESSGSESRGSNPSELCAVADPATGLPVGIESHVNGRTRRWLGAPATLSVRKETTGASASPTRGKGSDGGFGAGAAGPARPGHDLALVARGPVARVGP